ncbi:MAG TPA: hypothetical protein EYH16_00925 [Leucothrix mucor]|nr:hypothetical protein [Leucothrix mucor]
MSAYSFAIICLRVLAVYIFYQVAANFPIFFIALQDESAENVLTGLLSSFVTLVLSFIIAAILWWFSPFIAKKIIDVSSDEKTESVTLNPELNTPLNTKSLQTTVIITVGFLLLMFALPNLFASLVGYFQYMSGETLSKESNPFFYGIVENTSRVTFSLLLILGAGFWVQLLQKINRFGLKEKGR